MRKFYYYLVEQPGYRNEIYANSQQEVKNLLMESLADESSIVKIVPADDKIQNDSALKAAYADASEFDSSTDFMNAVMKSANVAANMNKEASSQETKNFSESNSKTLDNEQPKIEKISEFNKCFPKEDSIKYFEDSGIKFKLENGKLYKKVWVDVSSADDAEFRIIKVGTEKPADKSKFRIEKLDWIEL